VEIISSKMIQESRKLKSMKIRKSIEMLKLLLLIKIDFCNRNK